LRKGKPEVSGAPNSDDDSGHAADKSPDKS